MRYSQATNHSLLALLPVEERKKVIEQCTIHQYAKGEQVVREMERGDNMYFIDRGRVQVTLLSRDGREVIFASLEQGEHFGELAVIDGKPRSADVVALTETQIMIMPAPIFRQMLLKNPEISGQLLEQLVMMIRRLCDRIFEFSTIGVNNRIHAELLRLAQGHLELDGITRISNPPTHAQIASRVSCHREAVSRELKALERRGILVRKNRNLIIADIELLQKMVDQVIGRDQFQVLPKSIR